MAKKRRRVDPIKWPGVYQYKLKVIRGKPDLAYYITFKDGTKKVWEKVGTKSEGMTPQIADDIRKERTLTARHGERVMTAKQLKRERALTNKTLDAVADAYLEQRGGKKMWGKYDRYRYDKHVQPILGKKPVAAITVLDIQKVKNRMSVLSAATVWGALELIRRFSNYGRKVGLTPGLKFTIEMPKRDNEVVQYLTPEEAARLLKTLDEWKSPDVANMLRLAMFSGARRGEIFKLQDCDLDFDNHLVTLQDPKGGKTVKIPMNPIVEKILRNQIKWRDGLKNETRKNSPYLFPNGQGGQRTDSNAVSRLKAKAKLPKDFRIFHGLRHHYAVTLANSGEFSLDMIGELLTHKSPEMTKRYAAYIPETMQKAGNRAAEVLQQHVETTSEKEGTNDN